MKRYYADECCKEGWEDAQFYLCSDVKADRAAAVELVRAMRGALQAAMSLGAIVKPRKLDEALTWRANDDKARALITDALARADAFLGGL